MLDALEFAIARVLSYSAATMIPLAGSCRQSQCHMLCIHSQPQDKGSITHKPPLFFPFWFSSLVFLFPSFACWGYRPPSMLLLCLERTNWAAAAAVLLWCCAAAIIGSFAPARSTRQGQSCLVASVVLTPLLFVLLLFVLLLPHLLG